MDSSYDESTNGVSVPKISVIIPSFNQGHFIERTIRSVLDQNYSNIELIVVDGGSTDNTMQVLAQFKSFIAHCVCEPDDGQSDALNKGFALATGDICGWLNSDDLYLPRAFATVAKVFTSRPDKSVICGDWLTIDENDRVLTREVALPFCVEHLKYEGFLSNAQAMFWRREVHDRFGAFNTSLHRTMDYEMMLRFAITEGVSAFYLVPTPLACFRRHKDQKTQGFDATVVNEHFEIAKRFGFLDKYRFSGKLKRLYYRVRRGYWYIRRGAILDGRKS